MDHDTSGKVDDAPFEEEAVGVPCHVGQRTVDEHHKPHHEEQIGREAHTLSKRTRDKRWGDDGKLHLEQRVEGEGYCGAAQQLARRRDVGVGTHVLEHQKGGGVAQHSADVVAKRQAEAEDHP